MPGYDCYEEQQVSKATLDQLTETLPGFEVVTSALSWTVFLPRTLGFGASKKGSCDWALWEC